MCDDFGSSFQPLKGIGAPLTGYAGVWDGGLACAFNGAVRWVTDATEALVAPLTLEAWVWVYGFNGAYSCIMNWAGGGANGCGIFLNPSGQLRFAVDNLDIHDPTALSIHAWHHVAAVYSGGTATLYKDGVSVASSGGGGALGSADLWAVGETAGALNPWNGLIASPAVYHYALNTTQMAAHIAAAIDKGIFPAYVAAPIGGFINVSPGAGGVDMDALRKFVSRTYVNTP